MRRPEATLEWEVYRKTFSLKLGETSIRATIDGCGTLKHFFAHSKPLTDGTRSGACSISPVCWLASISPLILSRFLSHGPCCPWIPQGFVYCHAGCQQNDVLVEVACLAQELSYNHHLASGELRCLYFGNIFISDLTTYPSGKILASAFPTIITSSPLLESSSLTKWIANSQSQAHPAPAPKSMRAKTLLRSLNATQQMRMPCVETISNSCQGCLIT